MYKDMELRKLPPGPLCRIANILETNSDWKRVMSLVPKNPLDSNSIPKYNNEHMRLIEDHARATNKKCAEILFDEWGTSGRVRPTLKTLYNIVIKASIYRAADEIAEILNESPPSRPNHGPVARIDCGITDILNETTEYIQNSIDPNKPVINNDPTAKILSSENNIPIVIESYDNRTTAEVRSVSDMMKFSESMNIPNLELLGRSNSIYSYTSDSNSIPVKPDPKIDDMIIKNPNLKHFEYKLLEGITNKFSDNLTCGQKGLSGRIGSGGFGEVFVGLHQQYGYLAVKKFRQNLMLEHKPDIGVRVFNAEVNCLSQLRHKNIVPIIGYSIDGPSLCVVCEFIEGRSLEQNLEEKRLNEEQRLAIMLGTAEGLQYIHESEKPFSEATVSESSGKKNNFMHGDVKSANILLTKDCVPKLCDFGLAKHIDSTFVTTSLMGTSAYMAPEGFKGTITQKNDIFSFGIVLLEILTGLKPIVADVNEKINIKDYVEEHCMDGDITRLLDKVVGVWTKADQVYELAKKCLQYYRTDRPKINDVYETLYNIVNE